MCECVYACMCVGVYIYCVCVCGCQDRSPEMGVESIKKLLDSVDEWIPTPARELEKPFLMPVEGIFSIPGRGTVVTGRMERGTMRKGDTAEFVGLKSNTKTTITGDRRNTHTHTTHTHTHTLVGRSGDVQTGVGGS